MGASYPELVATNGGELAVAAESSQVQERTVGNIAEHLNERRE
jgi:hypothetical protein